MEARTKVAKGRCGAVTGAGPAVSVVMAACNSAATIAEAIESVRRQTREDWELIVVDDGSRDGTADLVETFTDVRIRVIRELENRGPAFARNRAISLAQAPLVATLDSDDLWLPQYLATMISTLDSDPGAAIAFTDAWVLDDATGRVRKMAAMAFQDPPEPLPTDPDTLLVELLRRNFIYNSVTFRREAFTKVGGYDERLWIGEDWELWLRLAAAGFRFARVPQLLAVYRRRGETLTSDSERAIAGRNEVYRVVAEDWDVNADVRDLALRQMRARDRRRRRRNAVAARLPHFASLRAKVRDSMHWYREPPQEVAELLGAVATTRQA